MMFDGIDRSTSPRRLAEQRVLTLVEPTEEQRKALARKFFRRMMRMIEEGE